MITRDNPDLHASRMGLEGYRGDTSPLRHPLSKPLLLAVAVMLGLSMFIVWDHHRTWSDVQRVVRLSNFIAATGNYVHDLQIERGLSSLYLAGKTDAARKRLEQHRIKTDIARAIFQNAAQGAMATRDEKIDVIKLNVLNVMHRINMVRRDIDEMAITSMASFDYYSILIEQLFTLRQAVAYSTENTILYERVVALNQLNHIKELSGQIRALGSEGFSSGRLSAETHQKLIQLVGIQNEHLEELPGMISPQARAHLNHIQSLPEQADMLRLRQMLMNQGTNLPTHDAMTWFETATSYIDKLKEVEDILIDDLQQTSLKLRRDMTFKFYGLLGILTAVLGMTIAGLWKNEQKTRHIRRELEGSLRAEQARSSQILEAMSDAVCVVRADGSIEYANPAMRKAFGDKILEASAETILPCVGSDGCALTAQGLESRNSTCTEALSPISGRGYAVHCTPFYTWDNKLSRLVVMSDVTAHIMAEQRLLEAKEAAESANRTKSSIMANMSHELRTPLNAIIGFSDMMLNSIFGRLGSEQYVSYARDIHDSGRHLLDLINDILDVSAIEVGKIELQMDTFSVIDAVNSAVRLVTPRALKGDVKLSTEHTGKSPLIYADERRLKQILLNLLSNAVKFTPVDGQVITRTATMKNGGMTITIADTGVGMTAEEIELAFEPFGQADSGLDRKHEGTGLGLPLTKGLVELHGGTLDVRSAKGAGTSVILSFPCAPQQQKLSHEESDNDNGAEPAMADDPTSAPGQDMLMAASMATYHPENS